MRAVLGFALVGVFAVAAGLAADDKAKIDAKKLVGKWEPTDGPKGGKAVVEFAKDGTMSVEVEFDGKADRRDGLYKLDGNKLTITLRRDGKDKSDVVTVTRLTDDEMEMLEDGKKKAETLKRLKVKR